MKRYRNATDIEIIAAVTSGDTSAFSEIVRRYEPVVARTVIGMLGIGAEAEDAGQAAMIKIYRSLGRYRADASFKSYVTRIAMNAALDAIRQRQRAERRMAPRPSDETEDPLERIEDVRSHTADHERNQLIEHALAQLTPEFRSVAVLRLLLGCSADEVARLLKISEGTVYSRLSRARRQMMATLGTE
ncbi:MAG: sigma-70 family RNA polymerase sigma factor [Pseudomonadota bacterium]